MAYVDVNAWSPEHVVSWLRGLHPSLAKAPMDLVIRNRVNGKKLMLLCAQDISDLIPSILIEPLQAVLQGIELLRYITGSSPQETLQSLILNLACQARYVRNQILQAELSPRILPVTSINSPSPMTGNSKSRFDFAKVDSNMQINQSTKQRVSLETLDSVSIVVERILQVVDWVCPTRLLPRLSKFKKEFKQILLRIAVELTSTAQRDQFVERPNDIIKETAIFLAEYCEWVVLAINDPYFIQPCWLDVVSVRKTIEEDDFGISIQPTVAGLLSINEVAFSAPAHRSGRISVGDEIIQVDYQTVVGWPSERVQSLIKTFKYEMILTIKKKPSPSSFSPLVVVMRPYAIPLRRISSHNSDSQTNQDSISSNSGGNINITGDNIEELEENATTEQPKEPKGPVYELQPTKVRRELKRRVSISGSIPDALVDLSLADSLPLPSIDKSPPNDEVPDRSKLGRIARETLTKSVSHDTAKLYLHTLSIDRKHL